MKMDELKEFVKECKWELYAIAGIAIGGAIIGLHLTRHKSVSKTVSEAVNTALTLQDKCAQKIDADIFTSLAPEIENMILANVDGHLFRNYELGDGIIKIIEVSIK